MLRRNVPKRAIGLNRQLVVDYAEGELQPGGAFPANGNW